MSLINDALKQAQKNQSAAPLPSDAPPLRMSSSPPVGPRPSAAKPNWLVPALVVALIVAAIFIIGLAASRNSLHKIVVAEPRPAEAIAPEPAPITAPAAPVAPAAVVIARPLDESIPESSIPVKNLPRLQGIFYSPNSPSAIIEGKTVRAGEKLAGYYVKQINKTTVILVGQDGKPFPITMN